MRRLLILLFLPALLLSGSAHALDDPALAMLAAQYQQLIRDGRDPSGQAAAALIQQAEQQARQKNWPAAITAYETALAAAGQTATWLALSQTWQTRAEQPNQGDHSADARQRARQAAWNALQSARAPFERARALFRLGDLYDRVKEPKRAMIAYREALELEDNPRIAKRYQELAEAGQRRIRQCDAEGLPEILRRFSQGSATALRGLSGH